MNKIMIFLSSLLIAACMTGSISATKPEPKKLNKSWIPTMTTIDPDSIEVIPSGSPVPDSSYTRVSVFGMRKHPILKTLKLHAGDDYMVPKNTPVMAVAAGRITEVRWQYNPETGTGYGWLVKMSHDENDVYQSMYAHLNGIKNIFVKVGDIVDKGDVIALSGNSGGVSKSGKGGYHLHFEILYKGVKVNPHKYCKH